MSELVTLQELQNSVLREGELLIDTYVGSDSSLLFAITREECRVTHLPPEEELRIRVNRYVDLLDTVNEEDSRPVSQDVQSAVRRKLFDLFFSEIEHLLRSSQRIFIAPDGPLNLIPFAQLSTDELGRASDRNAGTREWARVPSASVLARLRRSDKRSKGSGPAEILAIGSGITGKGRHLPGTLREVQALAREFTGVEVRAPSDGDSMLSESDLQRGEILHLAAHVQIDDQSPWQTEVQLRRENSPDNLKAGQIATMQLPARLVVLSGCESGSGRILAGEGVLGLTSAFLSAGVPTVIASLWPVDDRATISFMRAFYDGLAENRSAGAALEFARRQMRANEATAHPFYWAGFILVGEPESRFSLRRNDKRRWLPILAIGLIVVVGSWIVVGRARPRPGLGL
jgi:CHAT domain-containing protein